MKLIKIAGIEIKLHFSTLLIIALFGYAAVSFYTNLTGQTDIWALSAFGALSGIAILGSILIHELMHSIMAQRKGLEIAEIELFLFGGMAKITGEPKSPEDEFKIAGIGPITSLLIGGILFGMLMILPISSAFAAILILYLSMSNVILGIFNLLPGFPMDGGRVLRAILWKRRQNIISATWTASRVGIAIGWILGGFGLLEILVLGNLGGFWSIIIGQYLANLARQTYTQTAIIENLKKYSVGQLSEHPPTINSEITLNDLMAAIFRGYNSQLFTVIEDGLPIGIFPVDKMGQIPTTQWGVVRARDLMIPISDLPQLAGNINAGEAIQILGASPNPIFRVFSPITAETIGFFTSAAIKRAMYFASLTGSGIRT
jgi:Zn-dependent protease